jgi:hypothetical protein
MKQQRATTMELLQHDRELWAPNDKKCSIIALSLSLSRSLSLNLACIHHTHSRDLGTVPDEE